MQALSQRVEKLESDVATTSSVESRVTDIEERVLATPSGEAKAAVVLAVSHLDHAVLRSIPFLKELDALKAVAGDDATLADPISTLEPMAETGVPSLIELRASFPDVATEVSRVQADWTGEDWVDKALSRVTSLVSVRKTGADAMAAEGEHVFVEMTLRARTVAGEPYRNHYVFVFRIREGLIVEIHEHLDTLYAQKLLFDPVGWSSPLDS